MRLKLISCEVLYREMCAEVSRAPHPVDVEFLPKGLHDLGGKPMATEVQKIIDAVPEGRYEAILLGYGLCGNGLAGITARHTQVVLPRSHDCIALLMGSRHVYQQYFDSNPGTYYESTGWLERGKGLQQLTHATAGMDNSLAQLIARYGEDNGRYLFEEMGRYRSSYSRLAFIETGLETDGHFEQQAREYAGQRGWTFEKVQGSLRLFARLLSADWDEDSFLVVQPGQAVKPTYGADIIGVAEIKGA